MKRLARAAALVLIVSGLVRPGDRAVAAEETGGGIEATIEVLQAFSYTDDRLLIRLTILNNGDRDYEGSSTLDLVEGLRVAGSEGAALKLKKKGGSDKARPSALAAGSFLGFIQDIKLLFPDMKTPGAYSISWEGGGVTSNRIEVRTIPRFDPESRYLAVFETDFGSIEFDLLSASAPKHVQNFHDLVQQGFYDNTLFHQLIKGVELHGGDPTGTGEGNPIYLIGPEASREVRHMRGTLSAVRVPRENKDDGSRFVLTLEASPHYDGVLSVIGQMTSGEEVLAAIESLPTSGQFEQPVFRPLKPVILRKATIKKVTE
jgi:peptidyl-prolyl cis-trans isomerase B (cyclophilin B)